MPLRSFGLAALALALAAPAAIAAPAADTRIQLMVPDHDRHALWMPISGLAPRYTIEHVSETQFTLWLEDTRLGDFAPRSARFGPHAWRIEAVANTVALRVSLAAPGSLSVFHDAPRGRLGVLVQHAPAIASEAEAGITTILGRATFDAEADALVVPYYGRVPRFAVRAAGAHAVAVDFANTAVEPAGVQVGEPAGHPLVAAWDIGRLAEEDLTRVTLVYRYSGGAVVQVDAARRRLMIAPRLGVAEAPAAEALGPAPMPTPGEKGRPPDAWLTPVAVLTPAPIPTPQPTPSPSQTIRVVVEAPHGLPAPVPVFAPLAPIAPAEAVPQAPRDESPFASPVIRRLAVEAGVGLLAEGLAAGAVDVGPAPVPAIGLDGRYDLDAALTLLGRFRYQDYTLEDQGAPLSRHHRDDFTLEAAGVYRLGLGPWQPSVGLGYFARHVAVASSVPPSLQRPFVFAPSQLFHGPWLLARLERELASAWRFELELASRPFVFAGGDEAVSSIGPLFGYGARPMVVWQPAASPWAATLGYRFDWLTAYTNDFSHLNHGPVLGAAWRF